jgi:HK97 family phage portal protein
MALFQDIYDRLAGGIQRAYKLADATGYVPPQPPTRGRNVGNVAATDALSLSTVYRAIQIHATAASQLPLRAERDGVTISPTPALVLKPDLEQSRSAFIEYTIVSLYTDGNAFWKLTRAGSDSRRPGEVVNITPLNPAEVTVKVTRSPLGVDTIRFAYRGADYTDRDIRHLKLLRVPGLHRGLGPIQAAQVELRGALDARDYGSMWLSDGNMPDGVLTTDQVLAPGMANQYKNLWYGRDIDGKQLEGDAKASAGRLRVLGAGMSYSPLLLKPSDLQFLETQQFNTTQIARLMGTPASLLLAAVEGNSQTYSNVEQDWIGYVRFSLMKALREMEEAITDVLPGKQTTRFTLEVLMRTDTKTRYEGHKLAIDAGWLTDDEVRGIEGWQPLTDTQRAAIAARAPIAPTTTKESTK